MIERMPVELLLALLFNLMGPISIMARFAAVTREFENATRRRVAVTASVTSLLAMAIAIALGSSMLSRFQIDRGSLILAAGVVLALASLRSIYPAEKTGDASPHGDGGVAVAISPIAVPGIVTPSAVGLLVIFASYFPTFEARLMIFAAVAVVIALNLLAMIYAHAFLAAIGVAQLVVLGAVFGILQVALAIQMIISGVKLSFP